MTRFRRTIVALALTMVAAIGVRLRGSSASPRQGGGWRELERSELR